MRDVLHMVAQMKNPVEYIYYNVLFDLISTCTGYLGTSMIASTRWHRLEIQPPHLRIYPQDP